MKIITAANNVYKILGVNQLSNCSSRIVVCHGGYRRSSVIPNISYTRPFAAIKKKTSQQLK